MAPARRRRREAAGGRVVRGGQREFEAVLDACTQLRRLPGVNELDVRVVIGSARHVVHEIGVRDDGVAPDVQPEV
jgi:hypothetical protein